MHSKDICMIVIVLLVACIAMQLYGMYTTSSKSSDAKKEDYYDAKQSEEMLKRVMEMEETTRSTIEKVMTELANYFKGLMIDLKAIGEISRAILATAGYYARTDGKSKFYSLVGKNGEVLSYAGLLKASSIYARSHQPNEYEHKLIQLLRPHVERMKNMYHHMPEQRNVPEMPKMEPNMFSLHHVANHVQKAYDNGGFEVAQFSPAAHDLAQHSRTVLESSGAQHILKGAGMDHFEKLFQAIAQGTHFSDEDLGLLTLFVYASGGLIPSGDSSPTESPVTPCSSMPMQMMPMPMMPQMMPSKYL